MLASVSGCSGPNTFTRSSNNRRSISSASSCLPASSGLRTQITSTVCPMNVYTTFQTFHIGHPHRENFQIHTLYVLYLRSLAHNLRANPEKRSLLCSSHAHLYEHEAPA